MQDGLVRVFVSYSHDAEDHRANVIDFAKQLESLGIDVRLDAFVEDASPPADWPIWMYHEIRDADFVVCVCTEAYKRRAEGDETKPTGSRWEASIISHALYNSATNAPTKYIPVIVSPADHVHIPYFLAATTRYVIGTPGERRLDRLLRRLTRRSEIASHALEIAQASANEPVGPSTLTSVEANDALSLLAACPSGLPYDVLAVAVGERCEDALALLTQQGAVTNDGSGWVSAVRTGGPRARPATPPLSSHLARRALEESLAYIERHGFDKAAFRCVDSAVNIARETLSEDPRLVGSVFRRVEKHLKRRGDKRFVQSVAQLSIDATAACPSRTRVEVENEAHALICGVSWVHQRTRRLPEARSAAQRSLELGEQIHWQTNTAFCEKCLGRLARLEGEESDDEEARNRFFYESTRRLEKAIRHFAELSDFGPAHSEVGACYGLLARTHLVARQLVRADRALRKARELILDQRGKDYLDLLILTGDVHLAHDRGAAALEAFSNVIDHVGVDDAERSEIVARAYEHRANAYIQLGNNPAAARDFRRTSEIYQQLNEIERASEAAWNRARIEGQLPPDCEPQMKGIRYRVRLKVLELYDERLGRRPAAVSRRQRTTTLQWRQLIGDATQIIAIEGGEW